MTEGAADIRFARRDGITHLAQLYQRDPLRVLFPTPAAGDPPVAVIVTTSGGLVAGDRLDIHVELAPGAAAHVTASAAEKVYRSTGRTTTITYVLKTSDGLVLLDAGYQTDLEPVLLAGMKTLNLDPSTIKHVIVIDLENESFDDTFGAGSPATYLNDTLVPQGELLTPTTPPAIPARRRRRAHRPAEHRPGCRHETPDQAAADTRAHRRLPVASGGALRERLRSRRLAAALHHRHSSLARDWSCSVGAEDAPRLRLGHDVQRTPGPEQARAPG